MISRYIFSLVLAILIAVPAVAGADESAPALLASGRVDEAIAALHGQINSSPNDAIAHNLLCRAYFSLGDWDRGVSDCEKAVSLTPENGKFHLWLGRIYGEKADRASFMTAAGLARRVAREFEAAVHLNPSDIEARTDLAEFYLEAPGIVGGGRDKAEQQATTLRGLDPAKAHWVNARIAEKKKEFPEAEKEYRAAIDASHGAASAWLNLGLFYKHRERWDDMVQALSHVRSAPLDRPDALVDAAEIYCTRSVINPKQSSCYGHICGLARRWSKPRLSKCITCLVPPPSNSEISKTQHLNIIQPWNSQESSSRRSKRWLA